MAKKGEIDPWNVDIVDLTDKFLKKIEDLRVSGRIILYASLLLRMKSEILLNEMYKEEDELDEIEIDIDFDLDSIDFKPVRRKIKRYTTLDDLVNELRRLERLREKKRKKRSFERSFEKIENISHEEDVEEKIIEVYKALKMLGMREISFLKLIKDFDKSLKVTYYISILHLAYRNMLKIEQEVPYGDIRVVVDEGRS